MLLWSIITLYQAYRVKCLNKIILVPESVDFDEDGGIYCAYFYGIGDQPTLGIYYGASHLDERWSVSFRKES